jgi:RNA polymerase sigma factor (TIGR02999 family)
MVACLERMAASDEHELTGLLKAWAQGDRQALEQLTPRVYAELHRLANLYMGRERPNHPLQTTALINEAYIRLIDWKDVRWQSRTHFFAMAARLMRQILVDMARTRDQHKRGGQMEETTLDESCAFHPDRSRDLVAIDDALTRLGEMDPRKARIIELRFFAGLSVPETAVVTGLSERTVLREWNRARAWLHLDLSQNIH